MSNSIDDVLRDIVDRHGRELIENHRRVEGCLRDGALAARDMSGLMAALKDGIPKRLVGAPPGTLSQSGIANMATQLSENSGLSNEVAVRSVKAWVHALRLAPPDAPPVENTARRPSDLIEAILGVIVVVVLFFYITKAGANWTTWYSIWIYCVMLAVAARVVDRIGHYFGKTNVKQPS